MSDSSLLKKSFGKTDQQISIVGLGGEGVLRTFGREAEAVAVIEEALNQGITYFDCARAYSGSEGYYGLVWKRSPNKRSKIFQTSKSAMRSKQEALLDLENTLENMGTDYLDLWQIHDVRTEADFRAISGPGGALEAFLEAKEAGRIRFIGVTGHHDPSILTKAVKEWPVDAVLLPVNPVEKVLGGFLDKTIYAAKEKGIAVIGMKVLGASHYVTPNSNISAKDLIRFALSQDVSVVIVGCSSPMEVRTLSEAGRDLEPMSMDEQQEMVDAFSPYARRLAYYRGVIP